MRNCKGTLRLRDDGLIYDGCARICGPKHNSTRALLEVSGTWNVIAVIVAIGGYLWT